MPYSSVTSSDSHKSTENEVEQTKTKAGRTWFQVTKELMKSFAPRKLLDEVDEKDIGHNERKLYQNLILSKKRRKRLFSTELLKEEKSLKSASYLGISIVTTENRTLVCHSMNVPDRPKTMNLYEAFGITTKFSFLVATYPLLVIEVTENGLTKRYLVPRKYSFEGRWLLYGRRVYIYMGHAFVEHRARPNFFSWFVCVNKRFRMADDFYQCIDCQYACPQLREAMVTTDCCSSGIITHEMRFPYDAVEDKKKRLPFTEAEMFIKKCVKTSQAK